MEGTFPYACEKCGEPVLLTDAEYQERLKARGRVKKGRVKGGVVRCPTCSPPVAPDVHPLAGVRRRNFQPLQVEMPKAKLMNLTPGEREAYGVIATLRHQETQELKTIASCGAPLQAAKDLAAEIDAMGETWKIVAICSPASIYRDLQGSRGTMNLRVEAERMGMIGRADLVENRPRKLRDM